MKNYFLLTTILLIFILKGYTQNCIIAGQSIGANIHYIDYIPDSGIYLGQNNDGFLLDLDKNGRSDLLLNMGVTNWLPYELWTWSTIKILNENIKICLVADTINWVGRLDAGDTISGNNTWSSGIDSIYYFQMYSYWNYPPPGGELTEGEFGSGFLGFQMNYPDETFYGWINVEATNFTLTAKESAIRGLTVGITEYKNLSNPINFYPNPFRDMLTIEANSINYSTASIEIVDLYGKIITTEKIAQDKIWMNTSSLAPGIYLIRIIEGDRIISRTKAFKI